MDSAPPSGQPPRSPEDYYMDGPHMVFTAAYHLKRGYCCASGCRHCPYRTDNLSNSTAPDSTDYSAPAPADD